MNKQPTRIAGPSVWARTLLLAAGFDALAIATLFSRGATPSSYLIAIALHVLAIAAAGFPSRASRSQRMLTAAFTLALPLLGVGVAMLAIGTRRRGVIARPPPSEAKEIRSPTVADVYRLTNALSACESLMSGSPDERSATVAMLARHPDAGSIALLRRAVAGSDPDLAVEAALALEDLGAHLDARAADARQELARQELAHQELTHQELTRQDPACPELACQPLTREEPDRLELARQKLERAASFDRLRADADALAEAIHSGLPDSHSILRLVEDARRGYERAAALDPDRLPEMASTWARLELDVLCPEAGLVILDRAAVVRREQALAPLRAQATRAVSRSAPNLPKGAA